MSRDNKGLAPAAASGVTALAGSAMSREGASQPSGRLPHGAKFTRGPWRVEGPADFPNPNVGMWQVEGATNICTHCTLYDATLIAAAPSLYAALRLIAAGAIDVSETAIIVGNDARAIMQQVRAALAIVDGSPEGEDALAASSETTARAEGIAETKSDGK